VVYGYTQSIVVSGLGTIQGAGPDPRNPGPSAMAVTPDGRTLVTNLNGVVSVVSGGAVLPTPAITLPVLSAPGTERGLLGIALDPNFATNGYVYMYYEIPGAGGTTFTSRLSRFTMTGNTISPASELILKELQPENTSGSAFHMGGAIGFGTDGKLYLGVGDQFLYPVNDAQDLTSDFGKILRLNPDGSIPSDNPFVSTPGVLPEIYAYGFRNPFSLGVEPGTNQVLVNDVGEETWEEIDNLIAGGNYGWNQCEGPCAIPGTIQPYFYYGHNQSLPFCSGAIVGGTYSLSLSSAFAQNSYFYADYCAGTINSINLTGPPVATPLASNLGFIVATAAAPDGGLYYLSRSYTGVLGLIEPVPEPGTFLLCSITLIAGVGLRRRRI
jgi:hypothetical protein